MENIILPQVDITYNCDNAHILIEDQGTIKRTDPSCLEIQDYQVKTGDGNPLTKAMGTWPSMYSQQLILPRSGWYYEDDGYVNDVPCPNCDPYATVIITPADNYTDIINYTNCQIMCVDQETNMLTFYAEKDPRELDVDISCYCTILKTRAWGE